MIRPVLRPLLAAGLAGGLLGGCALLQTPDPIQLYRFGATDPVSSAAPDTAVPLELRTVEFSEAASDDRILAITGAEAAYIGGARWVERAESLYQEAVENAFAAEATRVRLSGRRELSRSPRVLDLDVRTFEARYPAPGAAPTVRVAVRARLLDRDDRQVVADEVFTVEQPAGANRVSAIVAAFDAAVLEVNREVVRWTEARID
jgi:cholesterol transport system auxiliary component